VIQGGNIMFTFTTKRFALTLPFLSALLVSLSGQPLAAQPAPVFAASGSPGETNVMVAQAATVVSTAHYQAQLTLGCANSTCAGDFPAVAAKRRLNITRITCGIVGSAGSTFSIAQALLQNANNITLLSEFPTAVFSGSNGLHSVNQAIDMQIHTARHLRVVLVLASGTVGNGICTATGTLETLQ
jgi:hypothetical protein